MKIISKEIKNTVPEAYLPFSAYVIQTRALPDARDCLKTGGRYILWSQYLEKNTYDNNRRKGADIYGPVMHWNPHGDAGIWDNIVRFAKPFSMRYLLEDPKGNVGTIRMGKDHAAPRYLELRSSEIANEFTKLIKKNAVEEWKLNYSGEDKYPAVLPTLFPNFVNGNTGIGVGCASSIPCFNLTEVINSLKILVNNRDASYDEIYVAPDFPTGAIIINANEVKESLRTGRGKAIKLRAVIEYDVDNNALEIQELPYQVYTSNIVAQIETAIESGNLLGIKNYYDGTDKSCGKYRTKIVLYLNKGANVKQVIRQLYKETSLQDSFTVCQLMLEDGIKPREYGLKDMMLAYLDHAMNCLKRSYEFDLNKIKKEINKDEGFLIAIAHIKDIVELIQNTESEKDLIAIFNKKYGLNEEQSKEILDLKLRRLMKLEYVKVEKSLEQLKIKEREFNALVNDKEVFDKAFIGELDRIDKKWGDPRRTKIMNLDFSSEEDDAEPIEKKELLIHFTNLNNIYTQESTTLIAKRRGSVGTKVKLKDNETITSTISDDNFGSVLAFTNKGRMYSIPTDDLPINAKINTAQLFEFEPNETITTLATLSRRDPIDYFVFITKNGMIKKTAANEYEKKRGKSIKAINLKNDDEVVSVHFIKNEPIGILTSNGNFVIINTEEITSIGRAASGVKAIKLSDGDKVICSQIATGKNLITISAAGLIKKASMGDFPICNRGIKGKKISGVKENDEIVKFLIIKEDCDIIVISDKGTLKLNTSELRELSRDAVGVKAIKLPDNVKIVDLVKA